MNGVEKIEAIRGAITAFAFRPLFVELLGWDYPRGTPPLTVVAGEQSFILTPVAQKRGVMALRCAPDALGGVPDHAVRRRIETQVYTSYHEHVIIYTDRGDTMQVWQWVKRQAGKAAASRE